MRAKFRLSILIPAFLFIFPFNLACQNEGADGSTAPDFRLLDLEGRIVSLNEHRGRVVLLDFWATWCAPCRLSIPELNRLQEKYREKGVVVLGISMDDPREYPDSYLWAFKEKYKINYRILRYTPKVVREYFAKENMAIPTLFVIDKKGRIRDKIVGFNPKAVEKSLLGVLE